ncbi:MAG TPA: TetR/AcrR family transcriptional regulator [Rhizomicrobium sp.]|jgi:AcrR family transcriptional regulator|nr:TetR/AcrR family transcriptional regulator [Rhizomicrobium sp.]
MPYPKGHRAATREKIIDSARTLFNRHGFDNVSIGQIMAGASLTHGAFYGYFRSKSDLYAEVLDCFFTNPNWRHRWKGVTFDPNANMGPQIVEAYLSRGHFEDIGNSCPLVALPSDVARNGVGPRRAFETVFAAMVELLRRGAQGRQARDASSAIAALCVGGMVIARAMTDSGRAEDLRDTCRDVALALGGWKPARAVKRRRSKT